MLAAKAPHDVFRGYTFVALIRADKSLHLRLDVRHILVCALPIIAVRTIKLRADVIEIMAGISEPGRLGSRARAMRLAMLIFVGVCFLWTIHARNPGVSQHVIERTVLQH